MTVLEERYMHVVPSHLKEIAEQLRIANELKAFELRLANPGYENQVDLILEGRK